MRRPVEPLRDALALLLQPPAGEGAEAQVQQTIVELDGAVARAGATSAAPAGDEVRQQEVQSVTRGVLSPDTHGVTSERDREATCWRIVGPAR